MITYTLTVVGLKLCLLLNPILMQDHPNKPPVYEECSKSFTNLSFPVRLTSFNLQLETPTLLLSMPDDHWNRLEDTEWSSFGLTNCGWKCYRIVDYTVAKLDGTFDFNGGEHFCVHDAKLTWGSELPVPQWELIGSTMVVKPEWFLHSNSMNQGLFDSVTWGYSWHELNEPEDR